MVKDTLGSYYNALKRALNPTFYETEWTSFQLMPVEMGIHGGGCSEEVVRSCVFATAEFLKVRNRTDSYWSDLVAGAPGSDEVRSEFRAAFSSGEAVVLEHPDVLTKVAVYCLLHAAFDSE